MSIPSIIAKGKRALLALDLSATTKADKQRVIEAQRALSALDEVHAETLARLELALVEPGQTFAGLAESVREALDESAKLAAQAKKLGA